MPPHVKQHTLSRFYIAGFGDSTQKPRPNPNVWYYPLNEPAPRMWRRERAKKISVREDYYTFLDAPPERRLDLERFFKRLEDNAAGPLKKLTRQEDPTSDDLMHLSWFIASMLARSPSIVDGFAEFQAQTMRNILQLRYKRFKAHPHEIAHFIAWAHANGRDIADTDDPEMFNPARVRITWTPANASRTMLEATADMVLVFARMDWDVLSTTEDQPFIASDAPVSMGLPGTGVELAFPLRKTAAVLLKARGPLRDHAVMRFCVTRPGGVREINGRTAAGASSFLIASSTSFPGVEELAP